MRNPLIPALLGILRQSSVSGGEGLSAHDILQQLADHNAFVDLESLSDQPQLQLFRKNFLLMNGLYQLQLSLWQEEGVYLLVSALNVRIQATGSSQEDNQQVETSDPVRDYFLDWSNFHETDEQDVLQLLDSFWQRFHNPQYAQQARDVLGLDEHAGEEEIKRRYRVLAAQHHPDKGGNEETFIEIRQAYEQLMG